MNELNFNIYGFSRPSTKAEWSSLLIEAVRLAEELESQIDCMSAALEKQGAAVPV